MTKVHGKRYAYKFDFHGLMLACQAQSQGGPSDPTMAYAKYHQADLGALYPTPGKLPQISAVSHSVSYFPLTYSSPSDRKLTHRHCSDRRFSISRTAAVLDNRLHVIQSFIILLHFRNTRGSRREISILQRPVCVHCSMRRLSNPSDALRLPPT